MTLWDYINSTINKTINCAVMWETHDEQSVGDFCKQSVKKLWEN